MARIQYDGLNFDDALNLSKDQKYRAKHLDKIREKDRVRAAERRDIKRQLKAKFATSVTNKRQTTSSTESAALTAPVSRNSPAIVHEQPLASAPSPTSYIAHGVPAQEIIVEARAMVWEWTKFRGPVKEWPQVFCVEFEEARGNVTVDNFAKEWRSQSSVGKALVKDLQGLVSVRLPKDEGAVRDIFRQAFDLLSTLHEGIAMIDAHLRAFGV